MAATLDQLRVEVLKDIERNISSAFEVCPKCSKGLLNAYSPEIKELVCNLNCEPILSPKTGFLFIDRRMKGLQIELEKHVNSTQIHEDKIASTLLAIKQNQEIVESEIDERKIEYRRLLSEISKFIQSVDSKTEFEEVFCSELISKIINALPEPQFEKAIFGC